MNFIITLIILILVLGIIVFIHELGHFIAAKKSGVHVYEFALGMGPKIFSFKRKGDPTIYSLRLLPLGGFNALASEVETSKGVRKEDILENKTHLQRFFVLIMGIVFNFILAIVLLFINGLAYGSPVTDPYIGKVLENSPAYEAGLKTDDLVLSINVAIINFIPIPVFDGGRILLLLIEKIKGKKLNPKIETTLNNIGTILLLILMLYVTLNDILKIF